LCRKLDHESYNLTVFKYTYGICTEMIQSREMTQSIHDDIADAVMREHHSKWQVRYIAPEDIRVYGLTGYEVSRIIRSIIDALRSPHLEGRIRSSTDGIEELEHFADWIVKANRTTLDRFSRLRFLMTAISFIVFCELRSDNQKSQNLYGNGDDDRWGNYDLKGLHSERDSLVYEYIRQLFRLVCPLFCDLYLTCHGSDTILNKTEPIGIRGFELTETAVSPYPVLLDLVNLVKSGQFIKASTHVKHALHVICDKMGRMDLYGGRV
jgi:hypothetical protein